MPYLLMSETTECQGQPKLSPPAQSIARPVYGVKQPIFGLARLAKGEHGSVWTGIVPNQHTR
jgi:hypothetical protein